MLTPEEMTDLEARYPEVFPSGPKLRTGRDAEGSGPPAAYVVPASALIDDLIADYRRWRAVAVGLRSGDPGYVVARNALSRAHDRLVRHLRRGRVYVARDGLRFTYDPVEDSLAIAPPLVYAKKDRERKAEVTPTLDVRERDRLEAAHHAWEDRRGVRRERHPVQEEGAMLMVQLEPAEAIYLPAPDGREVKLEAPAAGAEREHSVIITIPLLNSTDRVEVTVGGRRIGIGGAAWKSGRTRLALDLPDACKVRYRDRDRKPLKLKADKESRHGETD